MSKKWGYGTQLYPREPKYVLYMIKICQNYAQDMRKLCWRYPKDITKIIFSVIKTGLGLCYSTLGQADLAAHGACWD